MGRLKQLLMPLSPHHRRILEKRRLEAVMHEHGIPKKLATKITNHFFKKDQND